MVKGLRLRLGRIESELCDVQRHFPAINATLECRRDDFSDAVRQNMLAAYEFLDALVADNLDLFSEEGLDALLQLNHLVLLGQGYDPREFDRHIAATRRQFFANFPQYVKPIRRWYRKHETENPYKVAAQVYVGVLSQPQLYQEGNHRTGWCWWKAEIFALQRGSAARQNSVIRLRGVSRSPELPFWNRGQGRAAGKTSILRGTPSRCQAGVPAKSGCREGKA